ncbi:MAG TPA: cupin domain-containing protein [Gaiellaceae bacterium]|nr:cupin domain-containing protein [Gaiellaceae bacterium]
MSDEQPLWFLGTLVRPKLGGEQTGGRLGLWEAVLPRGAAPPLHTHPQDETIYVLEGTLTTWLGEGGGESRRCGAGAVLHAPGGTPHAFRVESDTARVLFLSTPAGIEDWVRELAEPAAWPWLQPPPERPRVAPERLAASERTHGIVRLGPPPG